MANECQHASSVLGERGGAGHRVVRVDRLHQVGRAARRRKRAPADSPRNNNSEQQYPNLQKECEVLTTDVLAKTVGADPQDIQSTFVGAICRWQAANPGGLIDITRFWFEQGSLANERKVAEFLKYQIENKTIAGVASIVMKPNDPNGSCGVASDAAGVVGWWVNPQVPVSTPARRPSNSWSSRSRPIPDFHH